MSPITKNTFKAEILGGIFSHCGNTDTQKDSDPDGYVPGQDMQVIFHLNDREAREAYTEALTKAIRSGNILVLVDNTFNTIPVIEAVDDLEADFSPDTCYQTEQLTLLTESLPGTNSVWCSLSV